MKRYLTEEDIQMTNKHIEKMVNTISYQGNVNYSTVRFHCIFIRMAYYQKKKKSYNTKCWQACTEK